MTQDNHSYSKRENWENSNENLSQGTKTSETNAKSYNLW